MSEQKPEKKVVGRTVAIALGIICIILVVGLVGAVADYTSIINGKDSNISNLNNRWYALTNFLNSAIWVNHQTISQPASHYTNWTFSASYAGYVTILILRIPALNEPLPSPAFNISVEVYWFCYTAMSGVEYDKQTFVYQPADLEFPILPARIEIGIGNFNGGEALAENVTITYYY